MKQIFVFIGLMTGLFALAQKEYKPFAEEGKMWICEYNNWFIPDARYELIYYINGDTTIQEHVYKKMYCNNNNNMGLTELVAVIYENSKKVYCLDLRTQKIEQIYDFGVKVGDNFQLRGMDFQIVADDTIIVQEEEYRFKSLRCQEASFPCLEGVGGAGLPLRPEAIILPGNCYYLKECRCGDVVLASNKLFTEYMLGDLNDIKTTVKVNDTKKHEVYDLLGRKITNPVKGNIYIRGGKKFVQKQ